MSKKWVLSPPFRGPKVLPVLFYLEEPLAKGGAALICLKLCGS